MRQRDLIFLALKHFRNRLLRTSLTVAGISVGIGAMFFLVTLGYGLQRITVERIANVEALKTIDVTAGKLLTLDAQAIGELQKLPRVSALSPVFSVSARMETVKDGRLGDVTASAVEPEFFHLENLKMIAGKVPEKEGPAIAATTAALNLFGWTPSEAIGREIKLTLLIPKGPGTLTETEELSLPQALIVGVIESEESTVVYIPLAELVKRVENPLYSLVKVKVERTADVGPVKEAILAKGYDAQAVFETVTELDRVFGYIKVILGLFGLIALFVAAIGMLNTLTISLLERTRDLGLMKALGAADRDIWRLVITESLFFGLAGGLGGILLGFLGGTIVGAIVNSLFRFAGGETLPLFVTPPWFVLVTLFFAASVALITGLFPARRAAEINPLEAIRYE